jgi:hypothetical protein
MHQVHHGADRLHIGLGQHAVAEIEDVAGLAAGAFQNLPHLPVALGWGREQHRGLEIPLDRARRADAAPRVIERNAPVHADHVSPCRREILQERRCPRAEVDNRNPRLGGEGQRAPTVRLHVGAIVLGREAADPTIE